MKNSGYTVVILSISIYKKDDFKDFIFFSLHLNLNEDLRIG